MKYLYTITFLIFCAYCYGQNNTVSWTFESKKISAKEYTLIFNASVQEGWYVYSQFLESDNGPVPTKLVLQENKDITLEGKANEEGQKIEGFDKLFEMNISKFKKTLKISQKIKTTGSTTIKGHLTFMTCNDEMCLPPSDVPFELNIK